MRDLELWGGIECTVCRIGEKVVDQVALTGHDARADDIARLAELKLARLRYPVLWERVAPDAPETCDWRFSDERLGRLREAGVAVVAGLVHHGAGPRYADVTSERFVSGLAAHARAAASRYYWVRDWTPVNEPLTTARLGALYGCWYPHARDEKSFWAMLLTQVEGVQAAMREIRRIIPQARLVQTEDLGRTYWLAPELAHQGEFDNERRWMTWDLLAGRVKPGHFFHERLCGFGFQARLEALAAEPCPADVTGINHYLTSDRFLDPDLDRHPRDKHGGNGFQRYADVEAVRVSDMEPGGLGGVLKEAWQRYGTTLAVTEVHNGCTREEQLRWFQEAWDQACRSRDAGIDVEAVTAWSLLGAYDWDSLLTRRAGRYESGAFDVRGPLVRETALARMLKSRASPPPEVSAVLSGRGWWRRGSAQAHKRRPLLIAGATGTLGKAVAAACTRRDIAFVATGRERLSLANAASMARTLDEVRPWAVVNAAGFVRVDAAEQEREACLAANAEGAVRLGEACAGRNIPYVYFSSDLVFDGAKGAAYTETDAPNPLNVYGRSKYEAEQRLAQSGSKALIIRTAAFFSPDDPWNFAAQVVRELGSGRTMRTAQDLFVSPTFVPDLADATLDLLIDGETRLWHVTNGAAVSWHEFALAVARRLKLDTSLLQAGTAESFGWAARRPRNSALRSAISQILPAFDEALDRFARAAAERPRKVPPPEPARVPAPV